MQAVLSLSRGGLQVEMPHTAQHSIRSLRGSDDGETWAGVG